MKPQHLTVVLMGVFIILAIIYDAVVLILYGPDATISVVANVWAFKTRNPLLLVGVGMVIGGLIVHFFRWKPDNSDDTDIKQ